MARVASDAKTTDMPAAGKPASRQQAAPRRAGSRHPEVPAKNAAMKARSTASIRRQASAHGEVPEGPAPESKPVNQPMSQAEAFQELIRRASAGNEDCLAGLRKMLEENPAIWKTAGDVSALAERAWVDLLANGNALAGLAIPRQMKALKRELAGADPTPLEKLLVDVIGVCYLAAQQGEAAVASSPGGSIQQANFRLRKAESNQRRLLNAVKTLSLVRALVPRGLLPVERDKPASHPE